MQRLALAAVGCLVDREVRLQAVEGNLPGQSGEVAADRVDVGGGTPRGGGKATRAGFDIVYRDHTGGLIHIGARRHRHHPEYRPVGAGRLHGYRGTAVEPVAFPALELQRIHGERVIPDVEPARPKLRLRCDCRVRRYLVGLLLGPAHGADRARGKRQRGNAESPAYGCVHGDLSPANAVPARCACDLHHPRAALGAPDTQPAYSFQAERKLNEAARRIGGWQARRTRPDSGAERGVHRPPLALGKLVGLQPVYGAQCRC